jgi:hypothetical protein
MKRISFIITIVILMYSTTAAYARQTSFQVTVPPIPWYEFSKGQKDIKVNGTFLYLTGEIEAQETGGDVSIYGGGISSFYRYAFRDKFAFDIGGLVVGAGGDAGDDATMEMTMLSLPCDLEFQPVKTNRYSVILFGGFNFTWMYLGIDYDDGTDVYGIDIWSSMRGPQGGIQVAIKFTEFVFAPFFMITSLSGDAEIDINENGNRMSVSSGIPSTTSCYYGIDIIYLPWDITLSSILQQTMSSGDNQGYKTYVFTVSYRFKLEDGKDNIEIPAEQKPAVKSQKKPVNTSKQLQQ